MSNKKMLKKKIDNYLITPIVAGVILMLCSGVLYLVDYKSGIIANILISALLIAEVIIYFSSKAKIMPSLMGFALEQGQIQKELLREFAVPYVLLDTDGKILWANNIFTNDVAGGHKKRLKKNISQFFPQLTEDIISSETEVTIGLELEEKQYSALIKKIEFDSITEEEKEEYNAPKESITVMYLFDVTELNKYKKENADQKLVAGLLYIDNYDEVMEATEEVRHSLIEALVDRRINMYFNSFDAIGKKMEKDKYFFVFQQKYLPELKETKFAILDEAKSISVGNEIPITLSIGVGTDATTFAESYEYARVAIGLALGRGGDQAIIKYGEKISYYGGKSAGTEKSTRVKARVKAQAFIELLKNKDRVFIMGHSRPDADSFGATIGVYKFVQTLGKEANIIINDDISAIKPVISGFMNNSLYDEKLFINSEEAIAKINANTLVVVVDVNRPSLTACEEILSMSKSVVVFDHHRETNERIEDAILLYIEPYASSACEMVTEMLQYLTKKVRLRPLEADAIYAGILIDTDNFLTKTGVRTFEAAAFLKRNGADVVRVRKMFRSDMYTHKQLASGILNSEKYLDAFMISQVEPKESEAPTVIAAKVANDLLDVDGVRASFVVTNSEGVTYISARSVDDVNVQVVMEKLGGGGHANVAGAQLPGITREVAIIQIKELLEKMNMEGDL